MFEDANYTFYQVGDLRRAERFYRDVLELEVHRDPDEPVAVVHVGSSKIGLHGFSGHVQEGNANGVVTLQTKIPLEEVRDMLGERQVLFWNDISRVTGGRFLGFLDSEGNRLGIYQPD